MGNIISDLEWRYAVKKFDADKKLKEEDVNTLIEVARLTATSFGLQAWKLVEVKDKDKRAELMKAAYNQAQVNDASHLLVFAAFREIPADFIDRYTRLTAEVRDKSLEEVEQFGAYMKHSIFSRDPKDVQEWNNKQCYIAIGKVMAACAQMKIDSCPMEGFDATKVNEILGFTDRNLNAVLMLPVGFRHEEDKNQHLDKVRLPKADFFEQI